MDFHVGGTWAQRHEKVWKCEPCIGNSEPMNEPCLSGQHKDDLQCYTISYCWVTNTAELSWWHWVDDSSAFYTGLRSLVSLCSSSAHGSTRTGMSRKASHNVWHFSQGNCDGLAAKCLFPSPCGLSYSRAFFTPKTHILKGAKPGFLVWQSREQKQKLQCILRQRPRTGTRSLL